MLLRMFCLYDQGVGAYSRPFWSDHKMNAIRSFTQLVNDKSDPNNNVSVYPDQFVLFELGVFDHSTGDFLPHEVKVSLGNGAEYVNRNQGNVS